MKGLGTERYHWAGGARPMVGHRCLNSQQQHTHSQEDLQSGGGSIGYAELSVRTFRRAATLVRQAHAPGN